jgi:hypothetical protein
MNLKICNKAFRNVYNAFGKYMAESAPNINGFTPQVIEERQMNVEDGFFVL